MSQQLSQEMMNVMNLQGNLLEYFSTRGVANELAQDLAQEAVHLFLTSPTAADAYIDLYAQLA